MKDVGAGSRGMDGFSRRSSGGWGKTFQAEGTVFVGKFMFWRVGHGCGVCSWQPWLWSGKCGWDQPIQGFVGQAESFALCSVSNRELAKVFMKAEE